MSAYRDRNDFRKKKKTWRKKKNEFQLFFFKGSGAGSIIAVTRISAG